MDQIPRANAGERLELTSRGVKQDYTEGAVTVLFLGPGPVTQPLPGDCITLYAEDGTRWKVVIWLFLEDYCCPCQTNSGMADRRADMIQVKTDEAMNL